MWSTCCPAVSAECTTSRCRSPQRRVWRFYSDFACTATADARTRVEIVDNLKLEGGHVFATGFDRPNIRYRVAPKSNAWAQLAHFLSAWL